MAAVMKLLQLLLMGFLLQHVQATNDSRQDIQFEDWLSLFFDTNVNPNWTLIPTMDIIQTKTMDFLCSDNMAFNNGFPVVVFIKVLEMRLQMRLRLQTLN